MIKILSLFVFILFCSQKSNAQTIKGKVLYGENPIVGSSVLLKYNQNIKAYTKTDQKGNFILINEIKDSLVLEVSALNFEKEIIFFKLFKDTTLNITLHKKAIVLNEVIVSKERAVKQKKDTTIYNPNHFKDGSEKVLEDLLKKLPGISVKKDGKIFFKEREIDALMLEGEDLFNAQYTIGSKNIDVDLVESIEAVENFNTNRVLKKIKSSEKVALNIKIKKGKTDLNLNTILENNFIDKYNNSITGLLINSKIKAFSSVSINNIGVINVPSFNFSTNSNIFQKNKSRELLPSGNFPTPMSNSNSFLNKTLYNYSSISLPINKKIKSIVGLYFYSDKLMQQFNDNTIYYVENDELLITNQENQIKKPKSLGISNTTTFFNNKDIQIESKLLIEKNSNFLDNKIYNNGFFQSSELSSDALFVANKLEITKKLTQNSAINLTFFLSRNKTIQNLSVIPGLIGIGDIEKGKTQKVNIESSHFNSLTEYFFNYGKMNFKLSNHFQTNKESLSSNLFETGSNVTFNDFINDLKTRFLNNQLKISTQLNLKKFSSSFTITYWHHKTNILINQNSNNSILFLFNSKYQLNKKNSFTLNLLEEIKTPSLESLFEGKIVKSYRDIISNEESLENIRMKELKLSYNHSDLYNTFYLNCSIGYSLADKDFYQVNEISSTFNFTKSVLLNLGNSKISGDFSIQKLIPFLKTTARLNILSSQYNTYNFVNSDLMRKIKNKNVNFEIYIYTGFKSKINFQNKTTFENNFYEINNLESSKLTQFINEFSGIYKIIKNLNLNFNVTFLKPDINKSIYYNFLNFEVDFITPKYPINVYIRIQNLANIRQIKNEMISDFSKSSFSYNIQNRLILLGLNFKLL